MQAKELIHEKKSALPANTIYRSNVGPMLVQRERWASIGPTLDRCVVFAGLIHIIDTTEMLFPTIYQIRCSFFVTSGKGGHGFGRVVCLSVRKQDNLLNLRICMKPEDPVYAAEICSR